MGCDRLEENTNLTKPIMTNIETEPINLEENLNRIKECVREENGINMGFDSRMEEVTDLNEVLVSTGFLREDMSLRSFRLISCIEENGTFQFWLSNGIVALPRASMAASCSIGYVESPKEGVTVVRTLKRDEKEPERNIHYLYREELKNLSDTERKIFEALTLIFWNNL